MKGCTDKEKIKGGTREKKANKILPNNSKYTNPKDLQAQSIFDADC